ncbi:polysaccharide biosynthesis/export family protein [Vibrio quintilis]|uniref:Polysialic acid transport protein KpsD n=1 Tax=Vibrio quintilis TaxID=1117707 RepID=A0A1M7Z1C6_9VIBR|nr:polysaccharide biosynthesis/export family protein [Vibrio quintilis]SHO58590.1 Polysialic acid transport protein KpsD precursor [Vibrio quintilis]
MRVLVLSILSLWLLAASLATSAACTDTTGRSDRESTAPYHLGPGDQIRIMVYGEPGLSMTFMVNQRGSVNYPFIGQVQLAGKSLSEIEATIARRLKGDYLREPMVSVTMEHFRRFYITGEIEAPNGYEYLPGLTIEQAIALAGGLTDRADDDDIQIRHSGRELQKDVPVTCPVHPGDTIIIGKSFF